VSSYSKRFYCLLKKSASGQPGAATPDRITTAGGKSKKSGRPRTEDETMRDEGRSDGLMTGYLTWAKTNNQLIIL